MLSMNRFRELLGPDCELNEDEVRELRRRMHMLAEIIVEAASVTLMGTSEVAEPSQSEEETEAH
jgi:hypothetical protein